jgi:hypothetical protein
MPIYITQGCYTRDAIKGGAVGRVCRGERSSAKLQIGRGT